MTYQRLMIVGGYIDVQVHTFVPTDIAGLKLWLKADAGLYTTSGGSTPATADADPVGRWEDQSGNGNHAIQATSGKRPLLKTNIQNGKPCVLGDGVDDILSTPSIAGLAAYTIILVYRHVAGDGYLLNVGNTSDNSIIAGFTSDMEEYGSPRIGMGAFSTSACNAHAVTANSATPVTTTYKNGSQVDTTGSAKDKSGVIDLFNTSGDPDAANGYLAEVCVYDSIVSAGNLANLFGYLNTSARWLLY